jgi:hypothetical protein
MRLQMKLMTALVLISASSRGAGITDEASVNTTSPTPGNPRSGSISDSLRATFDIDENWSVLAGALITLEESTPAPAGAAFGDRGGLVSSFSGGGEYHPGDNWVFALSGDFSPKSTQRFGTQLNITTATGADSTADALLRARSSSADLQLSAEYDSAGDSSVEWSLTGGIQLAHLSTDQRIVALQEANGTVATTAEILKYCETHTCSKALLQVIGPMPAATLDSARLSIGGTLTLLEDTDVTINADYYAYEQDPAQIGYFSVGSTGRMEIGGGSGVPIAPLRYLVQPELTERIGDFSLRLWFRAGRYVSGAGQTTRGLGAKLQYKLTKAIKMWASASWQRDLDAENDVSISKTFAFGVGYKF